MSLGYLSQMILLNLLFAHPVAYRETTRVVDKDKDSLRTDVKELRAGLEL